MIYQEVFITFFPQMPFLGGVALSVGLIVFLFMAGIKTVKDMVNIEQEKQVAVAQSAAKANFIANMSHEIRTPINAVLGMNEMILRECEDKAILEYAGNIDIASQNLLSIINDILDFSKIESGKMEIVNSEYKLGEALNDVVTMIELKAKQKGLQFDVEIDNDLPDTLYGDDVRIKQILLNLLNNAVKYTPKGNVKLRVFGESQEEKRVDLIMSVQDTGIGIRKEDVDGLFQHFHRMDLNANRNVEGTGLGLAITDNLVRMMDGKIEVDSTYGEGTIFTVHITQKVIGDGKLGDFVKNYRKSSGRLRKYQTSYTAPQVKVLVVDDNQINLQVVKNLLKKTLMQIVTCTSGAEALELLCGEHYDVILLDHMMPQMDGMETLKQSKRLEGNKNIDTPVIALTANAVSGAKEMYVREGFTDYLSKPIVGKDLEDKIAGYLSADKMQPVQEMIENTVDCVQEKGENGLLNPSVGMKYCAGNKDIYLEVLKMFFNQYEVKAVDQQRYYENANWNDYTVAIHSLKTNAMNVGSEAFAEKCLQLERAGKKLRENIEVEESYNFICENHQKTMRLYEKLIMDIKEYLIQEGVEIGGRDKWI